MQAIGTDHIRRWVRTVLKLMIDKPGIIFQVIDVRHKCPRSAYVSILPRSHLCKKLNAAQKTLTGCFVIKLQHIRLRFRTCTIDLSQSKWSIKSFYKHSCTAILHLSLLVWSDLALGVEMRPIDLICGNHLLD